MSAPLVDFPPILHVPPSNLHKVTLSMSLHWVENSWNSLKSEISLVRCSALFLFTEHSIRGSQTRYYCSQPPQSQKEEISIDWVYHGQELPEFQRLNFPSSLTGQNERTGTQQMMLLQLAGVGVALHLDSFKLASSKMCLCEFKP